MGVKILQGDCRDVLKTLPDKIAQCCVTSPPYWGLRDYGCPGQIGLEQTPKAYVAKMVKVFQEVKRVLRDDGTLWLNLGDSYSSGGRETRDSSLVSKSSGLTNRSAGLKRPDAGLKPKDLVGIPWRVAFALQQDGWYLRQDIIWHKPNPMPESVTDRCTKAHEYIFLLSKSAKYYCDMDAIKEPATRPGGSGHFGGEKGRNHITPESDPNYRAGSEQWGRLHVNGDTRNRRSVWTVATQPYKGAHFATFPPALIQPCILAGCPVDGTVLDCFGGSGTTGEVAAGLARNAILIELNSEYHSLIRNRVGLFAD